MNTAESSLANMGGSLITGPGNVLPVVSSSGPSFQSLPQAGSPSQLPIPRVDRLHTSGVGPKVKILHVAEYLDGPETLVVFKQVDGVMIFIRNLQSWHSMYKEVE